MLNEWNNISKNLKTIIGVLTTLIAICVGVGSYIKGVSDVSNLQENVKSLQENYSALNDKLLNLEKSNNTLSSSIKYYEAEIAKHCDSSTVRQLNQLCIDLDKKLYELQSKVNLK
ncbi:hypothetical protein [Actinobacillus minor]|uniref:hypothetical protein n=1 Tax=Actinobacillus minor TaxID=51047 RepID=UPI0005865F2B|nr:hypothetical protein [Actinobacillus minor]